jgi:chromosome segregation protein
MYSKKYLDYRENLKILELNLFIRNVEKLKTKIAELDQYHTNIEDELLQNNRKNARFEDEYAKLKTLLQNLDDKIQTLQNDVYTSNNEVEKFQGEINVLNEKLLNIEKDLYRLDDEIRLENDNINKLNMLLLENQAKLNANSTVLENELFTLETKNKEFQDINNRISSKVEYIDGMKEEVVELLNQAAGKKSSINSYYTYNNNVSFAYFSLSCQS